MANPVKLRIKTDFRGVDFFLSSAFASRIDNQVYQVAEALKDDIRDHWSDSSPSNPGEAPAIDTGNLDSAVKVSRNGRDEQGRFTSAKEAKVWFVQINTAQGADPQGRGQYAAVLEDEMDRPYLEPAIDRVSAIYPTYIKRAF